MREKYPIAIKKNQLKQIQNFLKVLDSELITVLSLQSKVEGKSDLYNIDLNESEIRNIEKICGVGFEISEEHLNVILYLMYLCSHFLYSSWQDDLRLMRHELEDFKMIENAAKDLEDYEVEEVQVILKKRNIKGQKIDQKAIIVNLKSPTQGVFFADFFGDVFKNFKDEFLRRYDFFKPKIKLDAGKKNQQLNKATRNITAALFNYFKEIKVYSKHSLIKSLIEILELTEAGNRVVKLELGDKETEQHIKDYNRLK